jgi:hypothetical protein
MKSIAMALLSFGALTLLLLMWVESAWLGALVSAFMGLFLLIASLNNDN